MKPARPAYRRCSLPIGLTAALAVALVPCFAGTSTARAAEPAPAAAAAPLESQSKLESQFAIVAAWAADPVLVEAVRVHNATPSAKESALDDGQWAALSASDPLVQSYIKNPVGTFLRARRSATVVEAFVSDAAGRKVGFIGKPTRWCHAGIPKHDVPMTGQRWQGRFTRDESTGLLQIQIAVPIVDADHPIGSLVVGLSTALVSK